MTTLRRISGIFAAVLACLATLAAHADSFTYDVNAFGMVGNIVASCDSCTLNSSDVVSWAFSGQGININSSMAGAQTLINGTSLQATPTVVSYAFTPNSNNSAVFLANDSVNLLSYPTEASESSDTVGEFDVCYGSSIVYPKGGVTTCGGSLAYGTGTIATIAKSTVKAPELDSSSLVAPLTLLLGSLAVMSGRRARPQAR